MPDKARMIETVFQRELFDPAWYRDTYPDVGMLGMEPDYHYRTYGHLMDRAPAAEFADDPHRFGALLLPPPVKGRELQRAHEIARDGDHDLGIGYARLHVPKELDYTIDTLHANAALARNDRDGWLRHLNSYIGHFGAAPVRLRDGEMLLDRFTTDGLPTVTGGPLISVIMPAWNAEKTVRAAANSILAQTWRNLELLIIDDASEDGTWGVMQEIAASDERVKIWRNPINVGPYVSKNIVLSMAQGEWVTGHDADDWAHPQRLEHHIREIQSRPVPPRASVTFMVRLEENGMMDRFAAISNYSLDGIARLAAISCTFNADFVREQLGGWDNIRFGADSELIARSQTLIGDEFTKLDQISMLCMNFEGSLTNDTAHGVDRLAGPSQSRQEYSKAYMKWHKTLIENGGAGAKLTFPPSQEQQRPFAAPEAATVPLFRIRRNFSALTGNDPICDEPVTAICSSKRPGFADRVAQMLKAQTHENLHVIYVAHGPDHDLDAVRRSFASLESVTILQLFDANAPLGEALNLALDHCKTDLVAKIDDDDFYGPNYIRSAVSAFHYNGCDNVGIVGKARAYCYVEDANVLALRFSAAHENNIRDRVYGSTIFWSRRALSDQRFILANTGEDSQFYVDAAKRGVKIYSTESADYLCIRYAAPGAHTWNISARDFLTTATIAAKDIRLDLVYSNKMPVVISEVPNKDGNKKTPGFLVRLKELIAKENIDIETKKYRSLLMSKKHAKRIVPQLVPDLKSPETYGQFSDIQTFMPPNANKFVLKPASGSHSRGVYCLERLGDDHFLDMTTRREYSLTSLREQYEAEFIRVKGQMTRSCFTEEYIPSEAGYSRPHDFKAYCFGGHVALIMQKVFVTENRKDWRFKFWSPDWQDLGPIKYPDRIDPDLAAPKLGSRAVQLISELSAKIARPFIRVDVYITDSEVVFSEITPNPNGGVDYFNDEWDHRLGEIWAKYASEAGKINRDWIMYGGPQSVTVG